MSETTEPLAYASADGDLVFPMGEYWVMDGQLLAERPDDAVPMVPATEVEKLQRQLEEARAPWCSPIARRERWAGENPEPIPFPREYNDVHRIMSDYIRAIECSSSGPTPEERAEKCDRLIHDAIYLTYEVQHLRAEVLKLRERDAVNPIRAGVTFFVDWFDSSINNLTDKGELIETLIDIVGGDAA